VTMCSSSMAFDFHRSFPDGSTAIAYDPASESATKSFLGMRCLTFRRGTLALPAYGSIETRPMIHASASNVCAVRSYSAERMFLESHLVVTILPSMEGPM